jgi:hypothetical protein
MPAKTSARKTSTPAAPAAEVPPEEDYEGALAASQPKPADPVAKGSRIYNISQYIDILKEQYKNIKIFDIFIFTDSRTLIRTETSHAGHEYKQYIVQPLLINAIDKENKHHLIKRDALIKLFEEHYLSLFYSKFNLLKTDFQINVVSVDAKSKIRGEYVDYSYRFKPFADNAPIAVKLVEAYRDLEDPAIKRKEQVTADEFDYGTISPDEIDCV